MKAKKKIRLNFMQRLTLKLLDMKEEVEANHEEKWVTYRVGDKEICFSFDQKGEKIEEIGVFQDIFQVVDQKKIF